jgi:hypothetical protein
MSLTGNLSKLYKASFTTSTAVYLFDLFYELEDDSLIASFNDDEKYRIISWKDYASGPSIEF